MPPKNKPDREIKLDHSVYVESAQSGSHIEQTNISMSGDFRGSIVNAKSTLDKVIQSIGANPNLASADEEKLVELVTQLQQELEKTPEGHDEETQVVAELVQDLTDKSKEEKPNRKILEIKGENLKQAAKNLAEVMPTVLTIATQIVSQILQSRGP